MSRGMKLITHRIITFKTKGEAKEYHGKLVKNKVSSSIIGNGYKVKVKLLVPHY